MTKDYTQPRAEHGAREAGAEGLTLETGTWES